MDKSKHIFSIILYHDFLPDTREKHSWYVENFYPLFRKKHIKYINQFWRELDFVPFENLFTWKRVLEEKFFSHHIDIAFTECEPFLEDIIFSRMKNSDTDILLLPLFPFNRNSEYFFTKFSKFFNENKPECAIHYLQNSYTNKAVIKYLKKRFDNIRVNFSSSDHQIKILNHSITRLKYDEAFNDLMDPILKDNKGQKLLLESPACPLQYPAFIYRQKQMRKNAHPIETINPPMLKDPLYIEFLIDLIRGELGDILIDQKV